jgi:hypothetical protein
MQVNFEQTRVTMKQITSSCLSFDKSNKALIKVKKMAKSSNLCQLGRKETLYGSLSANILPIRKYQLR